MNVTVLTRYEAQGASSRLRFFQYLPYLAKNGLPSRTDSLLSDDYLDALYRGVRQTFGPLQALLSRIGRMWRSERAGVFWLEKEALPYVPWAVERLLLPRGVLLVTDYDDAVFHTYDLHPSPLVRRLLGHKIDRLMARSDLVMAGNAYLAGRARNAGARRVEVVPTVVDVETYRIQDSAVRPAVPVIGWIGTPSTWAEYMVPVLPVLISVAEASGARLRAVGAGRAAMHPLLDNLPWSEDTEVPLIQSMDIGIMPLTDTPWARGKCGYKLIQYMACGLPVIASPVGVNAEIVEHGVNGFLATTEAEWRAALIALLKDPALRQRMGAAGRRKVEAQYSLQVWGPRVAGLLRDVAEGRQAG